MARQYLHQRMGSCTKAEFLVLSDSFDRASQALDEARAALEAHIRSHGCEKGAAAGATLSAGEE